MINTIRALLLLLPGSMVLAGGSTPETPAPDGDIVELGKNLFFDIRLSGDVGFSCAKCHDPEKAFTDGLALSNSYPGGKYFRNTKTILNVRDAKYVFWDGRLSSNDLPTLVRDHIAESHFMNADGRHVVERLRQVPYYEKTFREVFGTEPRYGGILKAVAAYIKTLNSKNVPFDRFVEGDSSALSEKAKRGYELFKGKANCASCHSGNTFSDSRYYRTGVPENPAIFNEPMRHIVFRRFFKVFGVANYATLREDVGRFGVTKQDHDRGKFLTPSLREVSRTAPYMHNGMLKTLEDVIEFYDNGGAGRKPLGLSTSEKEEIIEFLKSLSGDPIKIEVPELLEYAVRELPKYVEPDYKYPKRVPRTIPEKDIPPIGALGEPPVPPDNPITDEKAELGKLLFFDARTSGDVSTSCASCHDPLKGWGDGNDLSRGYPGTKHWRNSQTAINSPYFNKYFWAGSVTSLEKQANSATTGIVAGNGDPMMIEERLAQVPEYVRRFKKVFGTDLPLYPDYLRAVSTFERKYLISRDTPFDQYARGDTKALKKRAKRGLAIFKGKGRCTQCHNGPNFSDDDYHNIGVPANEEFEMDPDRQITLRFEFFAKGVPEKYYANASRDLGLFFRTKHPRDIGKFRTPHLRELKWTAPYMHNGIFYSLEEVIDFYDRGGDDQPGQKDPLLQKLDLTKTEKKDLLYFLNSLSSKKPPLQIKVPDLPEYEVIPPPGDE